nr:hypothetical protein [Tanacetum cinerariifolium]
MEKDRLRLTGSNLRRSGYIAPEYGVCGHFSAKTDVYSFGAVVVLQSHLLSKESRKHRRVTELLPELNEIHEKNEDLLKELSKTTMERNLAGFAKSEPISRLKQLSTKENSFHTIDELERKSKKEKNGMVN